MKYKKDDIVVRKDDGFEYKIELEYWAERGGGERVALRGISPEVKDQMIYNVVEDHIKFKNEGYELKNPEPTYEFREHDFAERCKRWFINNGKEDILNGIIKSATYKKDPPQGKIYPCPICGRMYLRVGDFGNGLYDNDYKITCDNCDFTCPEGSSDYGEAWVEFKDWLKIEGYLK